MPDLMSAALLQRDAKVLAAHRRVAPFAGQWTLPAAIVSESEAAEDAVRRHLHEQFGVSVDAESFVDTVYVEDPDDAHRYVTNIFRASLGAAPLRFRADGDYDDARWLAADELEQLWMPPALRDPLVRIMRGEPSSPMEEPGDVADAPGEAMPLAERPEESSPEQPQIDEPPPDNRTGWDVISAAYQEERFGERYGEALMWSYLSSEDDLHVLGDIRGRRALVVGCGGGQDVVALMRMGAVAVGIDPSSAQIDYARKYAARHDADNASFAVAGAEDLSRFDDESFDLVVSSHALNYVLALEHALAEVHRVLRGGGEFSFSVSHPLTARVSEHAPYRLESSYWEETLDWTWSFDSGASARLRQRFPTIGRWYEMLTDAGFSIERVIEPREDGREQGPAHWAEFDRERARLTPNTMIFKTRKR